MKKNKDTTSTKEYEKLKKKLKSDGEYLLDLLELPRYQRPLKNALGDDAKRTIGGIILTAVEIKSREYNDKKYEIIRSFELEKSLEIYAFLSEYFHAIAADLDEKDTKEVVSVNNVDLAFRLLMCRYHFFTDDVSQIVLEKIREPD